MGVEQEERDMWQPFFLTIEVAFLSTMLSFLFRSFTVRCERLLQQLTVTFWGRRGHLAYRSFMFFRVLLPLAKEGVLAGVILSFARSVGEFGATMMVAGNIPGVTQTMATALYAAVQANDYELVYLWAGSLVALSLGFILLMNVYLLRAYSKT